MLSIISATFFPLSNMPRLDRRMFSLPPGQASAAHLDQISAMGRKQLDPRR